MKTINNLIKQHMNKLSPYERRVGQSLIEGKIDLSYHSITQAAKIAQVSPSLINKFCVKIGVKGWKTLKGLAFVDLRIKKVENKILSDDFLLLENTFINKNNLISNFINLLYEAMTKANKVVIFANGTTKKIAQLLSYKWNKLGGNIVVYNYIESFVTIEDDAIVLLLSISGINNKLSYYQKQSKTNNHFLITFGENKAFKGKKLELRVYQNFDKLEKSFPVITDVFLQLLLNKLIEKRLANDKIIKQWINDVKINKI